MRCVRDWSAQEARETETAYRSAKAELEAFRTWARKRGEEGAPSLGGQERCLSNRCGRLYRAWRKAQALEAVTKVYTLAVAYEKLGPPPSSIDEMVDGFKLYGHSPKN